MTTGQPGAMLHDLGEAIVRGDYPAGTVLLTADLARQRGVSRTVVRETLQVLAAMRMVTSTRGVGITVQPADAWNLYDPQVIQWQLNVGKREDQLRLLTELRRGVEPIAAALAARRATPERAGELITLARHLAVTAHARDLEAFLDYDIAFHHAVLAASGNAMFAQLSGPIAEVLRGRTHHHLMPPEPQSEAVSLHMAVAQAIATQNDTAAEAAARAIIDQAAEEMTATIQGSKS